jgi:hypothetical protein
VVAKAVEAQATELWARRVSRVDPLPLLKKAPKLEHWLKSSFRKGTFMKLVLRGNVPYFGSHKRLSAIAAAQGASPSVCPLCQKYNDTAEHFLLHCPLTDNLRRDCVEDIITKARALSSTHEHAASTWLKLLNYHPRPGACFGKSLSAEKKWARFAFFLGSPPPPSVIMPEQDSTKLVSIIDSSVRLFLHFSQSKRDEALRLNCAAPPSSP